jgi:hypothetical protein
MSGVPHPDVTESQVKQYLKKKRFMFREVTKNRRSQPSRIEIVYDVRLKEMPNEDVGLRLSARVAMRVAGGPAPYQTARGKN